MPRNTQTLHTQARLFDVLNAFGAELLVQYTRAKHKHTFRCACGSEAFLMPETILAGKTTPECTNCRLKRRARNVVENQSPHNLSTFQERAIRDGAILHTLEYLGNKQLMEYTCACGIRDSVRARQILYQGSTFRCKACVYASTSGENSPHWDPNRDPENRLLLRQLPEARAWSRKIIAVQQGRCAISGQRSSSLTVHHLWNWAQFPQYRFDVKNGIAIERSLHDRFHNIYGRGYNSPAQFVEYLSTLRSEGLYNPEHHYVPLTCYDTLSHREV